MKNILGCLLLLLCAVPAVTASECNASIESVIVSIPAPAEWFVGVSSDQHKPFESLVSAHDRLLCVFITPSALAGHPETNSDRRIVSVEARRTGEDGSGEITPVAFDRQVSLVKQRFVDTEAFNRKAQREVKALGSGNDSVGEVQPGTIFQAKDVYAFAMVVPITSAGVTTKLLSVVIMLRVKNRLVYGHIYALIEDENTLRWAGQTAESWARQILAANSK